MSAPEAKRLRLEVRGAVQGVGFRPFVYRLAVESGLAGWVLNDSRGVMLEVEGEPAALESFRRRLEREHPPRAIIEELRATWLAPEPFQGFEIRHSDRAGEKVVVVLPDVATCAECLAEVRDPEDRRHRYPFTNCTNCGPRFTIVEALPYDRPNTTMRDFTMCGRCEAEYEDPLDRRFHAQPNACPECGPRVELLDSSGSRRAGPGEAIVRAADIVRRGEILALKGLGGFHLIVDARDAGAVERLRDRKFRYEKPLALMVPDLDAARQLCEVPPVAADLLRSPVAPIALLRRRAELPVDASVVPEVAPGNPYLGLMLPYTPLHHLLLGELSFPVVATSGNRSDEPICIRNEEALERLDGIADWLLVHDRPIARHADDSVVAVVAGDLQPIRRARGLAPLPVILEQEFPCVLAVGAHLKNTVALSVGRRVFLSQHIGDMETPEAQAVFERVILDFLEVYEARPEALVHDLHPDYPSTQWARAASRDLELPLIAVQHHHAHLAACLADVGDPGPALGVTWDGTGYGDDGTVWGGEFLHGDASGYRRVAALRPFRLAGGEAAVREPRRVAVAALWEILGDAVWERTDLAPVRAFEEREARLVARMIESGFRSPVTTSAGRLFDAVASIVGLRQRASFEGQAAMALEYVADPDETEAYEMPLSDEGESLVLDWEPALRQAIRDSQHGGRSGIVSARFHNGLAEAIVAVAEAIGEPAVVLSGGCFQNRLLTERTAARLEASGFRPLIHRRVPPNDGGISLGQVAVAAARLERDRAGDAPAGG